MVGARRRMAPSTGRIDEARLSLDSGRASLEQLKGLAQQIRADSSLAERERARQLSKLCDIIWQYSIREYDGY